MNQERIERIREMESCLNRLMAWLRETGRPADAVREDAHRLDAYLRGGLWLADFEADEAGELPADLPRGVLSEDAAYDALAAFEERSVESAARMTCTEAAAAVPPGRWRHFKGGEYEVIGIARHSETEEPMVVYRALYGDGGLWVRPASMWNGEVTRDGRTFRRFTRIGGDGGA